MNRDYQEIETTTFTMQDVLELCGDDPPLRQRQAIHMVQNNMVSQRYFVSATARRRRYSFQNLLEFEIARALFVGFGVAPGSVRSIMRRLHNGGYFLTREQVAGVERDKQQFDNAAEFREHLNQVYKVDLLQYSSPFNLEQRGHKTVRVPRSKRQQKTEIKQIAHKVRRLASTAPRPWRFYVLVFRHGEGWDFDAGYLPGGTFLETQGEVPQRKVDEESYKPFAELISAHPGAILLNLYKLEDGIRRRFDQRRTVDADATADDDKRSS